jgi:hypothetical protein
MQMDFLIEIVLQSLGCWDLLVQEFNSIRDGNSWDTAVTYTILLLTCIGCGNVSPISNDTSATKLYLWLNSKNSFVNTVSCSLTFLSLRHNSYWRDTHSLRGLQSASELYRLSDRTEEILCSVTVITTNMIKCIIQVLLYNMFAL